jgi:hypothetical protein
LHQLITYFSWSMAIYASLQKIGIDIARLETGGLSSVVLTFGNSNFAGGMLSVLFTYHFIECVNSKSFGSKNISLLTLILLGTAFSGAFQGYLIVLFALCLGATLYIYQKSKGPWIKRTILLAWLLGLFSIALGLSNKFILASVFARETFQARVQYWKIGLEVMKDHLLFGIGPDKLFDVTANYMSPGSLEIITSTRMDNAHNWYLNFGANFGLMALLVQLLIFGYTFFAGMKITKDLNTKNDFPIAIFAAFLAIFIDGLVSIEQPGLGFWLYLFAGVTVGSSISLNQEFAPKKIAKTFESESKRLYFHQIFRATTTLVLLISTVLISTRVIGDTLLRKSIQTQLLNRGSDSTLQKIGSLAESLRADPEYSAQALNVLAAAGDAKLLDSVSEASYQYNKESIQATLVRADVLRALGRINEACPLRITLINNTPWDMSQLSKYLTCLAEGLEDPNYRGTLLKASVYVPSDETKQIPNGMENELYHLNKRFHDYAVVARLYFLLGNIEEANQHKTYSLKLLLRIQELESSNGLIPAQPDRKDDLTLLNF